MSSSSGIRRIVAPTRLAGLVAIGFAQAVAVAAAAVGVAGLGGELPIGTATAVAVLCGAALAGAYLRARERVAAEMLGRDVVHTLRLRMFRHLLRVSPQFLRQRRRGAAIVRFVGDLQAVRRWVSLGLARLAVAGTTVAGCLVALAFATLPLAAVLVALVGIGAAAAGLLSGPLRQTNRELRRRRGQLANFVTEQVTALEITQLHGRGSAERRRLERRSQRLGTALVARARCLGMLDAVTFAATAAVSLAVMLIGRFGSPDTLPRPGALMAALVAVALLAPSLRDLARVFEYWQAARVAIERFERFFGWPVVERLRHRQPLAKPDGRIEFRRVWLSARVPAFSAVIEPGEHVAVAGPNGVGKSHLLALLAGLAEPASGEILLGQQPLVTVDIDSLRRSVALVSADLPLVRGSLRRNLRYHRNAATADDATFRRVVELCALDDLVARLDLGLATRVTEGGRNLSHGERQRIALARALMASPRVLLLDEVDAHLDDTSRRVLDRVIRQFDGTIIAATHDEQLVELLDRRVELVASPAANPKAPVETLLAAVGGDGS